MRKIRFTQYINDAIHGSVGLTDIEYDIIKTKEFLRLKGIKQLSFGQLKYPSATHTRFSHCIGTLFVTQRYIDSLKLRGYLSDNIIKTYTQTLRLGALLHDIGHSAFSHSVEQALHEHPEWYPGKIDHEHFTKEIILGNTEVNGVLKKYGFDKDEIDMIAFIASGEKNNLKPTLGFLADILTGDFGSDRVDYLLRDSHHAGLAYGKIEFEQLVSKLSVKKIAEEKRLCIKYDDSRIGIHASTALELARYYHFSSLVFQPEIRSLNSLLKLLIGRLIEECADKKSEIRNFFTKYDDSHLLQRIEEFKFNTLKDKQKTQLLTAIREIQKDDFFLQYENIDDLHPKIAFLLYKILTDEQIYCEFKQKIEAEIRDKYGIDKDEVLIFDLNINGKSGLPTEMYIELESYRSALISDKSPLLLELAEHLTSIGSVSIISQKKLKEINFNALVLETAKEYAKKVQNGKKISAEYLLEKISLLCEKRESKKIFGTSDTDFMKIMPGLNKLNNYIKNNGGHYDDFREIEGFCYSKNLYEDLMILSGFSFIKIVFRPTAIGEDGSLKGDVESFVDSIKSMVNRYDFYPTNLGKKYLDEIK